MRENTLKQQLYAGKAAFGVMCTFPSPPVVEMLGCLGFDWILLDNEHGSITVDTAEACIAAAELTGMAPIVRPVGNRPEIIAPFLDRGAWGVQVPHVNTADEARAAVDAVKYGPEGHRGIFSGGRPAHYGFKGTTGDYAKEANSRAGPHGAHGGGHPRSSRQYTLRRPLRRGTRRPWYVHWGTKAASSTAASRTIRNGTTSRTNPAMVAPVSWHAINMRMPKGGVIPPIIP
jgi:HpcH/HpaI aldolase/citrate lyase family